MKHILYTLVAVCLLLTACSKANDVINTDPKPTPALNLTTADIVGIYKPSEEVDTKGNNYPLNHNSKFTLNADNTGDELNADSNKHYPINWSYANQKLTLSNTSYGTLVCTFEKIISSNKSYLWLLFSQQGNGVTINYTFSKPI